MIGYSEVVELTEKRKSFHVQVCMDVRVFTELLRTFVEQDKLVPRSNSDVLRITAAIAHRHIVPANLRNTMSTEQAIEYLQVHGFGVPQDRKTLKRLVADAAWDNEEAERAQASEEAKNVASDVKKALEGFERTERS